MRLLAIDTSLEACSVGVLAGDRPPVLASEVIGRGHAERLFGMIEAAMRDADLAFTDLDRIAVTVGPGSFTGLRVGIAAARGLGLVIGCELVGIGTLDVHAAEARAIAPGRPVLVVLDARRDEVYGQMFDADGSPAAAATVADAAGFARRLPPHALLAGSGAGRVAAFRPDAAIAHTRSAPDLATLVRLAAAAPPQVAPPRPLYLRPPDAHPQAGKKVARQ